jgi:hypothetical protein
MERIPKAAWLAITASAFAGLFACATNSPSANAPDASGGPTGTATSMPTGTATGAPTSTPTSTSTATPPGQDASGPSEESGANDAGAMGTPEAGTDSAAGDLGDAGDGGGDSGPPIVDLFNGTDLTGFKTYEETSNTTPGTLLTGAAAEAIFQPENGMIHVYGNLAQGTTQVHYMLETVGSYGHYNLTWQYQWGTKKFAPYTDLTLYPRDAGIMWHIHGDLTQVWPSSIEFQNKWGSTGDIFALYAQCTSLGTASDPTVFADYDAGGVSVLVNGSDGYVQHHRNADWEVMGDSGASSTGAGTGWNSCLLQVDGGAAVYTVNGHLVNKVLAVMDKNGNPVTSGPIAWQAEQSEVYYRNLQIQVIP